MYVLLVVFTGCYSLKLGKNYISDIYNIGSTDFHNA